MFLGVLLGFGPEVRAEEPEATAPESAPFWRTEMLVPAPLLVVRAALEDPLSAAQLSPDIMRTTYLTRGACPTLRAEVGGALALTYDYQRCATTDGWHETLVASAGLDAYDVRWRLEPVGDATRVEYTVQIDPTMPAPRFLVLRSMKRSTSVVLSRLYAKVTRNASPPSDE